ncbi:hypothetical protein GCM10010219_23360 [Streptomyces netropsis]|nr:hypothetical protein GCM10010219_23360 [Streptomyces netropsis]
MVVHQAQQRRLATECVGDQALDLFGGLPALQNDLAGCVLHADLDLHGLCPSEDVGSPMAKPGGRVRGQPRRTFHTLARYGDEPSRSPLARSEQGRIAGDRPEPPQSSGAFFGKPAMPRHASEVRSWTAVSRGTVLSLESQ